MYVSTVLTYTVKTIRMAPYLIACSMYRQCWHTLDLAEVAFLAYHFFGRKVFLIFPIIYQTVDLKLICIIGQSDLINLLILPISTLDDIFTHFGGFFPIFMGQLALKFHWDKMCFFLAHINSVDIQITLKLLDQSLPKSVYLLTMQEAHALTDQIWAKYEQLNSGKYGSVDTPAFKAEACELANLLACVSQLCQILNLPPPKELYRPMVLKHWRCFVVLNYRQAVWSGCEGYSFVCRSVRITGLLSAPLVLRNWDWLCVLPATPL